MKIVFKQPWQVMAIVEGKSDFNDRAGQAIATVTIYSDFSATEPQARKLALKTLVDAGIHSDQVELVKVELR